MTIRPKKDKQTNNLPRTSFETEYFPFEKKGPGQFRTQHH